jgi:hypothetical protein
MSDEAQTRPFQVTFALALGGVTDDRTTVSVLAFSESDALRRGWEALRLMKGPTAQPGIYFHYSTVATVYDSA